MLSASGHILAESEKASTEKHIKYLIGAIWDIEMSYTGVHKRHCHTSLAHPNVQLINLAIF